MGSDVLGNVTDAIRDLAPDHLAITGDLVNIGLDAEIAAASAWLNQHFDPQKTSLVPGNHDAYVRGALAKALVAWAPYITSDDSSASVNNGQFPYLRIRGEVAIIGTSSAIATPAFVAAGRFGKAQAERMAEMLKSTKKDGLFRVVLIHHPPVRNAAIPAKRLYGISNFQKVIADRGAELVLHGHTHLPQRHKIQGPNSSDVPVIGVPSASQGAGGKRPVAAINMFEIARAKNGWHCQLNEHSLSLATGGTAITQSLTLL